MPHHGGFSGGGAVMRCTALPGPRGAKGLQHSKEASGYLLSRSTVSSCMAIKGCSVCRTLAVRDSHGTCVAREHTTPPLGTRQSQQIVFQTKTGCAAVPSIRGTIARAARDYG